MTDAELYGLYAHLSDDGDSLDVYRRAGWSGVEVTAGATGDDGAERGSVLLTRDATVALRDALTVEIGDGGGTLPTALAPGGVLRAMQRIAALVGREGTSLESVIDRVAYLAEQHAHATTELEGSKPGAWITEEFERARERIATVPPHARPMWTRGSFGDRERFDAPAAPPAERGAGERAPDDYRRFSTSQVRGALGWWLYAEETGDDEGGTLDAARDAIGHVDADRLARLLALRTATPAAAAGHRTFTTAHGVEVTYRDDECGDDPRVDVLAEAIVGYASWHRFSADGRNAARFDAWGLLARLDAAR